MLARASRATVDPSGADASNASARTSRAAGSSGADPRNISERIGQTARDADPVRAERPSKTQRKSESHELQSLGTALLELADERIAALGLPEPLVDALAAARRMRTHEARRRQLQLVGKLMRSADVTLARAAIAETELGHRRASLELHRAERWRDQLIADDAATTRFASEHPGVDVQRLRSLVRSARKDAGASAEQRAGRAYRELFRFVREQVNDG